MIFRLIGRNLAGLVKKLHKNRRNLLCYSGLGGEWGSNPRHAPAKIRFRNLLYFSRLTNQFTIIFAPIWDNFGTLFEIRGKGFYSTYLSEFQCATSIAGITLGKLLGKDISL